LPWRIGRARRGSDAIGCQFALDDFGTGYAALAYLKHLPIQYLKIDIDFVRDLVDNPRSRAVVSGIVALAAGFGQRTIAEGVENATTLRLLRELGVDLAQGFHIGKPAPIDA
jgi:EAL domain-containing protein (putative c-di-GMP-specific phosphodiesterase class I)